MPTADLNRHWEMLSVDERQRAMRFRFDIHRCRFVAARGVLRDLLGRYTNTAPASIEFLYGPNGKPAIPTRDLHFNIAHAEDRGVFAFTRVAPLGVDLERVRPVLEIMQIAERFFSPRELEEITRDSEEERNAAFFRCWTQKEAIIKATGEGLSAAVDAFEVFPSAKSQIVCVGTHQRFFLYDLGLSNGFTGAVACSQPSQVSLKSLTASRV